MAPTAPQETVETLQGAERRTLTIEGLSVSYGGVRAVRDIDLVVKPGDCVGIIGANGAGKTSTLRALFGLVPRRARRLEFGTTNLLRIARHEVARAGIGYVPEGRRVFPGLSVHKNLLLGAYSRRWGRDTDRSLEDVQRKFPILGEMNNRLAGALSGGQQQMLAIGRALMSEPQLLVLDEPSMGLSPKLVDEIIGHLRSLNEQGIGILLVEQNAKLTFETTRECLVMSNGEIVKVGTSDALRHDPDVRRIYLGI